MRTTLLENAKSEYSARVTQINQEFAGKIRQANQTQTIVAICNELGLSRQVVYDLLEKYPAPAPTPAAA